MRGTGQTLQTKQIGDLTVTFDAAATTRLEWRSCQCDGCEFNRAHASERLSQGLQELLSEFGIAPDNAAYTTTTDEFPERRLFRFEGHFVVQGELSGGRVASACVKGTSGGTDERRVASACVKVSSGGTDERPTRCS